MEPNDKEDEAAAEEGNAKANEGGEGQVDVHKLFIINSSITVLRFLKCFICIFHNQLRKV